MGSFVEDLWSSIFTPGPTPTLLIATNITFAALQLVFLALLIATYSIHFVVLSVLSASLWGSINWFAGEVRQVQLAQEAEAKKKIDDTTTLGEPSSVEGTPQVTTTTTTTALDSTGSDSDTETELVASTTLSTGRPTATTNTTGSLQLPLSGKQEVRKRASMSGDNSSGYGSTDSEWEKVDGQ
ncbi:SMK killer toxin resistance protein [Aspergillus nanangensis]|uniref:SMK killer toxin resistance protein n=1 Tax=Aspergillus nanangensis TaxID=2582783 RepID=A0AAD4CGX6_ASPNN|nr:SMK killer toxin resistance protein [Aspergillus nanangensis]